MREHVQIPEKTGLGAVLGVLLGLLACGPAAEAANPLELNFWLSGPKYDGRLAPCEAALVDHLPLNSRTKRAPTGIPT